ncbi:BPI fold-containing family B member 2-like [Hyperolius riggenbachi]|uniref:BPI fold-containing family B member 2-like n=1 Tax=Hyperolius riggenbachi TaxID=752182 RepID=UPI0035A329B8
MLRKMITLFYVLYYFALELHPSTATPPCVGLLRYSQEALGIVFETQKSLLQDALSNSETSASVSGIKVDAEKIQIHSPVITDISVHLVPGQGIQISIVTDFLLSLTRGNKVSELEVLADVTSMLQIAQDSSGNPKLGIDSCDTSIKQSEVLQKAENLELLKEAVTIALNQKLCLVSSSIMLGINVQLGQFTGLMNLGTHVQLSYFLTNPPAVTSQYIEFGVNVEYYLLGRRLDISAHSECVPLSAQSSNATPMYSLLLPQDTFHAVFSAMEWAGFFNLDITGETDEGTNMLTVETIKSVSPEIAFMYPETCPVTMKVGVSTAPRIILHKGMMVMYLQPSLELMVMPPDERPAESLMMLSTDVQMKVHIKIDDHVLKTESVSLMRNVTLSLESTALGSVNLDTLQKVILPFLERSLLFHYKGALRVGWTLPRISPLKLVDPKIDVYEGYAAIYGNLQSRE